MVASFVLLRWGWLQRRVGFVELSVAVEGGASISPSRFAEAAEDGLRHVVHDDTEGDAIEVHEGAGEAIEYGAGALLAEEAQGEPARVAQEDGKGVDPDEAAGDPDAVGREVNLGLFARAVSKRRFVGLAGTRVSCVRNAATRVARMVRPPR